MTVPKHRVLAIEPYYGGSHRAVLDALVDDVDAEWTLLTLPARKWKWRMRGSAITMADRVRRLVEQEAPEPDGASPRWDLIFCSTFLNLAEFRGLAPPAVGSLPAVVYFHENQLVYPSRHEAEWDFQFPLTNMTTALAADRCCFNTRWNLERFLEEIPPFLRRFPDHVPTGVADAVAAKSEVLPPPFDPEPFDAVLGRRLQGTTRGLRPRLVWPHRWEHDKNPEEFFAAAATLAEDGLDFEVAVAGQTFQDRPDVFEQAERNLGSRLVHLGEPASREEYVRLLGSSDVAVSTASNEFFGLAMIEAAYAGCYPLVPDRLCYPELYPEQMRYSSFEGLVEALRALVLAPPTPGAARPLAERHTIGVLAPLYVEMLDAAVSVGRDGAG